MKSERTYQEHLSTIYIRKI